jgi:HK97 family phage prohead protease
MNRESKTLSFKIETKDATADDTGQEFGHLVCYGAVFNNTDDVNDRIIPGAFKRTVRAAKERAVAREKRYVLPMLWNHKDTEIIGGWSSVTEDDFGLKCEGDINLATQRGREYWALAKAGMADQFSILYETMPGGSKYNKSGVRELTELRLFSIDPVTFAANDATELLSIKSLESKSATVVGNTSGPLGERDEAWDGSKAEKEIWDAAYDEESDKINVSLAKKYFMVCDDSDPQKKGSYSYPFWYVGSSPHICVGAVKTIAAAIQGARGASAPEALKGKIETLYARINKKFPDDPELTPPWKDGEKGATMNRRHKANQPRQRKTFEEHYQEEQCEDLLADWADVILCAFTSAVYDAVQIGDTIESDVKDALTAFGGAVMKWVGMAQEYDLSGYLTDDDGDIYNPEGLMQYGSESSPRYGNYGYMSRQAPMSRKAMLESDATTGGFTSEHVNKLKKAATTAMKKADDHASALHDMANGVVSLLGASKSMKAGAQFSQANASALQDHADGLHDMADGIQKSLSRQMKAIHTVADDLATILQGSEAAYGTDPGTPDDGQQENKSAPSKGTRATQAPSSRSDTVTEDEITAAITSLHSLVPVK